MSDVFGVKRSRLVDVARPLDDGPAVGKHRELVGLGGEFQHESVESHLAPHELEVAGHLLEIELGRRPVGDLHGVAAAQTGRM